MHRKKGHWRWLIAVLVLAALAAGIGYGLSLKNRETATDAVLVQLPTERV